MNNQTPVPWEPYKAERCTLTITYRSGKVWSKWATVKEARYKAKEAILKFNPVEVKVSMVVGTFSQNGVNYTKFERHIWTKETGWTTEPGEATNNGYLY